MDAETFRRVMETFCEVCDLPSDRRNELLTALPVEDAAIVREVRRLLEAERLGSGRLDPLPHAGDPPKWRRADVQKGDTSGGSLSGTRIAQFEVGERIGVGGMGEVYAGIDTILRRRVALKAIRHDQRMSEAARRRFLREARMLSSLDHPNICRIYDYLRGEEEDLLVLELIRGRSLRRAVAEGLSSAEALSIAEQVADALAAAHAEGVVHRDLKLSNVVLTASGTPKVLDFGLARSMDPGEVEAGPVAGEDPKPAGPIGEPDHSAQFRTAVGLLAGTPSAMSPEQIEGRPASAASDMYSYGLLAQELFTGEPPYDPELQLGELIDAARHAATRPVSGLDRHLAVLIESLTARRARARPTASAVVERLRWIRTKPRRRLVRLAAASVLAIFVLGAIKYTFDLRRERTVADQRRTQAEKLIGFMLGDLRTKLEPLGRLDVLDDVGDEALDYFASVAEAELSDVELLSRAKALTQIGEVRLSQNRYDEALASFQDAYRHSAALAARNPLNGDVLFDRGQAEYWVGYVYWRRLEREPAQQWLGRYRDTSEALLDRDADRDDWVLEAAYAHHNLAVLALEVDDLEVAEAGFSQEVEVLLQLIDRDPGDSSLVEDLADAYSWLGTTAQRHGQLERAAMFFADSTAQRRKLVELEPENAHWRYWLSQALSFEAIIAVSRGQRYESDALLGQTVAILEELVEADRTNRNWLRALATARTRQATPLAAGGHTARAMEQLSGSIAILEELVAEEPGDRRSRQALATAFRTTARLWGVGGRPESALEAVARAAELCRALHGEAEHDLELIAALASTLVLAGELQQAVGNREEALASWNRALELLAGPAEESNFPSVLLPWSRALAHVGRTEEAKTAAVSLEATGFRSIWQ